MKRIASSLLAFGLTVALTGIQAVAKDGPDRTIILDVALDCAKFNYMRGLTLEQIVRGDAFMGGGKIFRGGTLSSGNNPNGPGSIGTMVSRGQTTATLAEHLADLQSPGIYFTQYLMLQDGALVTEGWFAPAGFGRSAVTGGMGAFRGARGEMTGVNLGTNTSGCPNTRLTITLEKDAPK